MDRSWPAVDFPLYGLAGEWGPPRWLDYVEGPLGSPATGVWLRHGSARVHDSLEPWVRVATLRRDRYAHVRENPNSVPRDPAFAAMLTLVDVTMPEPSGRPDDYAHRIVDFAQAEADRHDQWPQATWTIGLLPAPAPVFAWAGAWAGFTRVVPEVDVVIVGSGIEPNGLVLSQVDDTSAYHFDAHRPITFPETLERARARALSVVGDDSDQADDVWWPAHPDHRAALE